jgi:hypothetical protein
VSSLDVISVASQDIGGGFLSVMSRVRGEDGEPKGRRIELDVNGFE